MSELIKQVSALKTAAREILGQIEDIDAQRTALDQQRDTITSANVSKADFLGYLRAYMKFKAKRFRQHTLDLLQPQRSFGRLEAGKGSEAGFASMRRFFTGDSSAMYISDEAVFFYFEDVIIARLSEELEALDWENDALPVALRLEHLRTIEQAKTELDLQRAELVSVMREAGFSDN
ncbi:MAG: hypothetical protein HOP04_02275 [Methylophilaceae bacterium]|nr:hypothetical protein [Methylophilaceae bacterium]